MSNSLELVNRGEQLGAHENSQAELDAATRHIERAARDDADRDQLLWMLDLHTKPQPPTRHPRSSVTRKPIKSSSEVAA